MKKHILIKANSDKGVILLPGASGKALSNRYDDLSKELKKENISFLRVDFWNSKELDKISVEDIYKEMDKAVEFLKNNGCNEISFIGKSFGGRILLTYPNKEIKSLVLWAPAAKLDEDINTNEIKKIKCPILIIHGTKDDVVSLENSKNIVKNLEKGKLETIEGAGHSYEKKGEMDLINKLTVEFLKNE